MNYVDRATVLYRNASEHTLKLSSDIFAESMWSDPMAPRPARVPVPPGATVALKAELCLRRRNDAGVELPPVIRGLAPQLVPDGAEAEKFVAETFVNQLVSVAREQLKHEVAHVSGTGGERKDVDTLAYEQARRDALAEALNGNAKKPTAELRFVPAATADGINHID